MILSPWRFRIDELILYFKKIRISGDKLSLLNNWHNIDAKIFLVVEILSDNFLNIYSQTKYPYIEVCINSISFTKPSNKYFIGNSNILIDRPSNSSLGIEMFSLLRE